jgi:hypothetical protein
MDLESCLWIINNNAREEGLEFVGVHSWDDEGFP